MTEDIVADAFTAAGYTNFKRQVEVVYDGDVPIKAHLDFVFFSKAKKTLSVLEVKSPGKTPDTPYSSWEEQLYLQMGLLAKKYPDYTVDKGAILCLNLAYGEVAFFNGYTPDENIFSGLMDRARKLWSDYQGMKREEDIELATEPSPLCGFCNYISTCPRFEAEEVPELAELVGILDELQARQKELAKEIEYHKKGLLTIVSKRGPIKAGGCFLREVSRNRKVFNMDRLEAFLSENGCSPDEFKVNRPYSFLEMKKVV
ncbi:hypothetical protein GF1_16870 [Desulfolithobacter dissulfuricans]|uniref:DUF83 domain-containing protein n=1 Tax=Desulfolithobacter dissulfuricans TaxID=2795293 RepID=A0A915XL78_9BACT|nr:hypothetical protein GF1_16870 [Desulfolithobacter dissulfuricans]